MGLKAFIKEFFFGAEAVPAPAEVRTIHAPDGKRRVVLLRLSDGSHYYREEVFNDKLLDMRWEPASSGPKKGCATPEEALAEARKALPWLWAVED